MTDRAARGIAGVYDTKTGMFTPVDEAFGRRGGKAGANPDETVPLRTYPRTAIGGTSTGKYRRGQDRGSGRSEERRRGDRGGDTSSMPSARPGPRRDADASRQAVAPWLRRLIVIATAACLTALAWFMLVDPARIAYTYWRRGQAMDVELEENLVRNLQISEHIATLETEEGVRDMARVRLGLVQEGEIAVEVVGVETETDAGKRFDVPQPIKRGSVPAPTSIATDIADKVFGYEDGWRDSSRKIEDLAEMVEASGVGTLDLGE